MWSYNFIVNYNFLLFRLLYILRTMFCHIVRCLFIHLATSGYTIVRTNREMILNPDGHITLVVHLLSSLSHSLSANEIQQ